MYYGWSVWDSVGATASQYHTSGDTRERPRQFYYQGIKMTFYLFTILIFASIALVRWPKSSRFHSVRSNGEWICLKQSKAPRLDLAAISMLALFVCLVSMAAFLLLKALI
jgi:hypothetical protein